MISPFAADIRAHANRTISHFVNSLSFASHHRREAADSAAIFRRGVRLTRSTEGRSRGG